MQLLAYGAMALIIVAIIKGGTDYSVPPVLTGGASAESAAQTDPPIEQPVGDEAAIPTEASIASAPATAPDDDLLLTGVVGAGPERRALFEVARPGGAVSHFMLREQEQNEWLHVLSIDPQEGAVRIILKRPVVRIRNIGTEVVLTFRVHGKKLF